MYIIVGGLAAAGGYAISPDTVQGDTDRDFDRVWDAAIDIISIMGVINSQSHDLGKISAIVNGARINVTLSQLTKAAVRLKVEARKTGFPSPDNAQNIFIKIMDRVNHR